MGGNHCARLGRGYPTARAHPNICLRGSIQHGHASLRYIPVIAPHRNTLQLLQQPGSIPLSGAVPGYRSPL